MTNEDRAREIVEKIICTPSVTSREDRTALWVKLTAAAIAAAEERGCRWGIDAVTERCAARFPNSTFYRGFTKGGISPNEVCAERRSER